MNFLFIHRNFPAQFQHLAAELAKDKNNNVFFITNNTTTKTFGNIKKIVYKLKRQVPLDCHRYLRFYEESIIHGQAAAEAMISLQKQGFVPDVIYGHSWGASMFVKDIFPNVPYIAYLEWYYNPVNSDVDFGKKPLDIDARANLSCKNAHILQDLVNCDYGVSPTYWQRDQFPNVFHNKIKVIHEGVNTDFCVPNENVSFKIPNSEIVLTRNDEILTYATRGMEEYRGFPEFMKTASVLMKQRPNLHVIVGGEDRVCYGRQLKNDTWKAKMLRELEFDGNRLHFTGPLPYNEYLKLLQVSKVHLYLTYPFVLSWSLIEALSASCCIVASDTQPVKEVIQDRFNGVLTDFYDINAMAEKINDILDNPDKYKEIRDNARKTAVEKYDLKKLLPQQVQFIKDIAMRKPEYIKQS